MAGLRLRRMNVEIHIRAPPRGNSHRKCEAQVKCLHVVDIPGDLVLAVVKGIYRGLKYTDTVGLMRKAY